MTRVLIALTSHDRLGETGRRTGFHAAEAAHPWLVLTGAGYEVDLVSVTGGAPPVEGRDDSDPIQRTFFTCMAAQLRDTPTAAQLDPAGYRAILFAGGHGSMWDLPNCAALASLTARIYHAGGVVASVCPGAAGLVGVRVADGTPLVAGKQVAAFTNAEECAVGLDRVVPFPLADALTALGADHVTAPNFTANVVRDGRLVTGQNRASACGVAEQVIQALA